MYFQRQARPAGSVPWHDFLFSCSGRKQHLLGHTFHCTAFFAPSLYGPCFSHAVLGCSPAASWLVLPWCCPGVVLVWSKTSRSCRKKLSFAISYSGTRGICLSQGGPVNPCCVPELFLSSVASMNHLNSCLRPDRSMGTGFKLKEV